MGWVESDVSQILVVLKNKTVAVVMCAHDCVLKKI